MSPGTCDSDLFGEVFFVNTTNEGFRGHTILYEVDPKSKDSYPYQRQDRRETQKNHVRMEAEMGRMQPPSQELLEPSKVKRQKGPSPGASGGNTTVFRLDFSIPALPGPQHPCPAWTSALCSPEPREEGPLWFKPFSLVNFCTIEHKFPPSRTSDKGSTLGICKELVQLSKENEGPA